MLRQEAATGHRPSQDDGVRPPPSLALAAFMLLVLVSYGWIAWQRGSWLDEFWSMLLSDPALPYGEMMRTQWIPDTHPPLFNTFAYALRHVVDMPIEGYRLLVNGAFLVVATLSALAIVRRNPASRPVALVYALVILSLPLTIRTFADFRPYFPILCAISVFLIYSAAAAGATDAARRPNVLFGMVSAFVAIATHYLVGLTASVLVALSVLLLVQGMRDRVLIGLSAAAAWAYVLWFARLQLPVWHDQLDVVVMHQRLVTVLVNTGRTLAILGVCGAVALAGAVLSRGAWRDRWRFTAVTVASGLIGTGMIVVLAVGLDKPVAVDRYFVAIVGALAAAIAALAAPAWQHRPRFRWALATVSALLILYFAIGKADEPRWSGGARAMADLQRACPTTRILAASPWTLRPENGSRYAAREAPALRRGYDIIAARYGLRYVMLPTRRPAAGRPVAPGACPVVLWVQHLLSFPDKDQAFALAGLALPPGVVVTTIPSGYARGLVLKASAR